MEQTQSPGRAPRAASGRNPEPEASNLPSHRHLHGISPMLLIILALTVGGCGGDRPQDQPTGGASTGAVKGAVAPDFALRMVGGGTLRLSDLRGKAVIVDFWDTWCPPCRRALPHLQELQDEYGERLAVVGVAFGRDGEPAVAKFLAERNLTFASVMMDEQYETARAYGGLQSIPTTFLLDGDGVIREIWVGGYGKADYEAALKLVLGA